MANVSNTGGTRRHAWKSLMPTYSSQVAQTTAKAVVASLGRFSGSKHGQAGRGEHRLGLALAYVAAESCRATDRARRQRPEVERVRAGVEATRPARHAGRVPSLPVGERTRPLDRRGHLSEQLPVNRVGPGLTKALGCPSLQCLARCTTPGAGPRVSAGRR